MNIISVSSAAYSKADNSAIDCSITFDDGSTHPFTATANDAEPHGIALWEALNAGTYGEIAAYPGLSPTQIAAALVRSALIALNETDRTMDRIQEAIALGLTTITAPDVVAWANYRRALRAIVSTQAGTLPTKPSYPANT